MAARVPSIYNITSLPIPKFHHTLYVILAAFIRNTMSSLTQLALFVSLEEATFVPVGGSHSTFSFRFRIQAPVHRPAVPDRAVMQAFNIIPFYF